MPDKSFDVLVIGGGIHGAGVAQAVASVGHSVAILEKEGIASGTSGRSSKLIHGGLRYLETGQFALVRECLYERSLLLKNAPNLVQLKRFFIPIYKDTKRRATTVRAGLALYYALAGFDRNASFTTLPHHEWEALGGLSTNGLKTVFQYHEAQTDDVLLTEAVMRSAQELGATLHMPALFAGAKFESGTWKIRFDKNGEAYKIRATVLVNAAGPWANTVLEKIEPEQKAVPVELVQGSHIILEGKIEKGIYYVEAPRDRRGVFIMPWHGDKTLIGTSETKYKGDPSAVAPLDDEINYLLETAAHYFPHIRDMRKDNIIGSFAGLRVLPSGGASLFNRSRETLLHSGNMNIVTVYGGKLTSYRATGENVMKKIAPHLPTRKAVADTKHLRLG
ncbi:Aerobic glycerol-3-phosphate dehydrogenase [hydrothermal vent metagenome]|uniref:Aerobic glycerol-3-phosphate dehydrogenase n=1 Tax=hydrothermal vent metagenome TaxID=652676 RepID=A0A3B1BHQ6_9ZZZZ